MLPITGLVSTPPAGRPEVASTSSAKPHAAHQATRKSSVSRAKEFQPYKSNRAVLIARLLASETRDPSQVPLHNLARPQRPARGVQGLALRQKWQQTAERNNKRTGPLGKDPVRPCEVEVPAVPPASSGARQGISKSSGKKYNSSIPATGAQNPASTHQHNLGQFSDHTNGDLLISKEQIHQQSASGLNKVPLRSPSLGHLPQTLSAAGALARVHRVPGRNGHHLAVQVPDPLLIPPPGPWVPSMSAPSRPAVEINTERATRPGPRLIKIGIETEFEIAMRDVDSSGQCLQDFAKDLAANYNRSVGIDYPRMQPFIRPYVDGKYYDSWSLVEESSIKGDQYQRSPCKPLP
jgi:hypothetical protein